MNQLLDETVKALRSISQPVVVGLAVMFGAQGCASRQEAPRTPNANAFSKNNNAFAPNLSAEVTKKTVAQLTSKIDEQISQNNPSYATGVLKELSSESRCDRYVAVLRHLRDTQPQMREVVLDAVAHERSARMGAKAQDLLLYLAKACPKEGLALANIIEQPTRDLILNVQVQQGYPDVAAQMRNAAKAALGASR
ncbi:MAG: hypothetical protein NTV65_11370 [Proteobacteria bacterium]|nr:hypothetical protein [Pseudomonadota bacterium]